MTLTTTVIRSGLAGGLIELRQAFSGAALVGQLFWPVVHRSVPATSPPRRAVPPRRSARGQAASPHRHIVPLQDLTHRPPVDVEPVAELVDGGTCRVARDELLDLLAVELPG